MCMKLLVLDPKDGQLASPEEMDECLLISSYDKFNELTSEDMSMVDTVNIKSFGLGMSCFYEFLDKYRKLLDHIKFVIRTVNPDETKELKEIVHHYFKIHFRQRAILATGKYRRCKRYEQNHTWRTDDY